MDWLGEKLDTSRELIRRNLNFLGRSFSLNSQAETQREINNFEDYLNNLNLNLNENEKGRIHESFDYIKSQFKKYMNSNIENKDEICEKLFISYLKRACDERIIEGVRPEDRKKYLLTGLKSVEQSIKNTEGLLNKYIASLNLGDCKYERIKLNSLEQFYDMYLHCNYKDGIHVPPKINGITVNAIQLTANNILKQRKIFAKMFYQYFYLIHYFVENRTVSTVQNLKNLEFNLWDFENLVSNFNFFLVTCIKNDKDHFVPRAVAEFQQIRLQQMQRRINYNSYITFRNEYEYAEEEIKGNIRKIKELSELIAPTLPFRDEDEKTISKNKIFMW